MSWATKEAEHATWDCRSCRIRKSDQNDHHHVQSPAAEYISLFIMRLVQSTDSTVSWAQWDMLISPWEHRRAVESKQGCCPEDGLSMGFVADLTSKGYLEFSETNICALKKTHCGVFSFGFSMSLMSAIVCDNAGNNLWQSMKIENSWL